MKEVSKEEKNEETIDKLIDEGSFLLGAELVVYKSKTKERADETNTNPFELYKMVKTNKFF